MTGSRCTLVQKVKQDRRDDDQRPSELFRIGLNDLKDLLNNIIVCHDGRSDVEGAMKESKVNVKSQRVVRLISPTKSTSSVAFHLSQSSPIFAIIGRQCYFEQLLSKPRSVPGRGHLKGMQRQPDVFRSTKHGRKIPSAVMKSPEDRRLRRDLGL